MPCVIVHGNFSMEQKIVDELKKNLTETIEETLGKPSSYIMVIVDNPVSISFGNSDDPALFIEVKSIGLPGDSPARLSQKICQTAEKLLNVTRNRIYIEFSDSPREMWGWNGGTF